MSDRIKHFPHPNSKEAHPFKALTLCGKMVRFGGFGGETTCKVCIKIHATICTSCGGTGVKREAPSSAETKEKE